MKRPPRIFFEKQLDVFGMECDHLAKFFMTQQALSRYLTSVPRKAGVFYTRAQDFWTTTAWSCEMAIHVTLSRIFDTKQDNFCVTKLINTARAEIQIFGINNLKDRLILEGLMPSEIEIIIQKAQTPTLADINKIADMLKPHRIFHQQSLHPLRNNIHAHRIVEAQNEINPPLPTFVDHMKLHALIEFLTDLHATLASTYHRGTPILPLKTGRYLSNFTAMNTQIKELILAADMSYGDKPFTTNPLKANWKK